MSTSDKPCKCFPCSLNRLLDEHYPEGITPENGVTVMRSMAEVVGTILSMCEEEGDRTLTIFLAAVAHYRRKADKEAPMKIKAMH